MNEVVFALSGHVVTGRMFGHVSHEQFNVSTVAEVNTTVSGSRTLYYADEGLTWARGWGKAADALRVVIALRSKAA